MYLVLIEQSRIEAQILSGSNRAVKIVEKVVFLMSNVKKRLISSIAIAFLISVVLAISQVSPSRAILPFLAQADVPITQKDAGLESAFSNCKCKSVIALYIFN